MADQDIGIGVRFNRAGLQEARQAVVPARCVAVRTGRLVARLVLRVTCAGRCPICEGPLYRVGRTVLDGVPWDLLLCWRGCSTVRPQRAQRRPPGSLER